MTFSIQNSSVGLSTDTLLQPNSSSDPFNIQALSNPTNLLQSGDILDFPLSAPSEKTSDASQSGNSSQILQQFVAFLSAILSKFLGGNTGGNTQEKSLFSQDPADIQDAPPAYTDDGSPPAYEPPPSYVVATSNDIQNGNQSNVGGVSKIATTTPAPATTATTGTQSTGDINVDGGGKNTITLKNTSDKEQSYALFTNPGPGATSSFGVPNGFVTLKPGESANFKVPDQHSGYVQQMNNYTQADYQAGKAPSSDNFKATRAEYTFNADGSLYFNDSNIDGYNAALKMTSNGQVAGSSESILAKVKASNPNLISVVGGQEVIEGAQFFTDKTNIDARNAMDKYINHNDNPDDLNGNTTTYAMPDDNKAVRGTQSNALTLEFGNA